MFIIIITIKFISQHDKVTQNHNDIKKIRENTGRMANTG